MKKKIAGAILATMITGLTASGRFFYNLDKRVSNNSSGIKTNKENNIEDRKKIDDIHWYLIEKNNIKVPQKKEK